MAGTASDLGHWEKLRLEISYLHGQKTKKNR